MNKLSPDAKGETTPFGIQSKGSSSPLGATVGGGGVNFSLYSREAARPITLAGLMALLIWFGVYPAPLLELIRADTIPPVTGLLTSQSDKRVVVHLNERLENQETSKQ